MGDLVLSDDLRAVVQRIQLGASVTGLGALIAMNSLVTKERMSHENGITCRGTLRIVDNPSFPEHEFFVPGRAFPCRIRHGAASWRDDAKLVVRSASLKFDDCRGASPLDLLMNTGDVPLFWNVRNFFGFMKGTMAGRGKDWLPDLRRNPQALRGGADSVRRDPDSFAGMVYNSQVCFGFVGVDRLYRYVRYRLRPLEFDGTETGAPDADDRAHPWLQNPRQVEQRNRNYLKDELTARLDDGHRPVRFMLQMQLRQRPRLGSPDWISSAYPWDEEATPFHDLAVVTTTEALGHEEAQLTWFSLANHPDSLPIPLGRSIDDPHSLNNVRLAGDWARRARLLSYRWRGMPGPIPDSRDSPDWLAAPPMAIPPGS